MDALVFALVLVALTAFVAAPLYTRRPRPAPDERVNPTAGHDSIVRALRELEVDRTSGLLSLSDYETERRALESQAADLSREPDID